MNKKGISVWVPLIVALAWIGGMLTSDILHKSSGMTPSQKKLATILNLIENDYVDNIDIDSLIESTLPDLLGNLDPHSVYIPKSDLQSVNDELEGSFSGIGIQFTINNDSIMVIEVINGGPAEKVGLMAGDRIVTVDGEPVAGVGITNEKVFSLLRGPKDTRVKLGIKRNTSKKVLTYDIVRGDIPVTSIDAAYIASPGIGYLKVNKFGRTTYDEFWQALADLSAKGAIDFVIDLRGNTGGFMEMATLMANEFLPARTNIVNTICRNYFDSHNIFSDGHGSYTEAQIVVLLDEFSASASEIFAGAIQDNDRGLVVGRRSFGKGLIQHQSTLPDSSAVRLTVGRYYTPSGRCIQKDYSNAAVYSNDLANRFSHGEAFSADSIHQNTDLVYTTVGGRTVYGGGGIMPDVFVPNDTTGVTTYYLAVLNAGLLQRFAFDYCDSHRERLAEAQTSEQLMALLPADDSLLRQFVTFASRNGIPARWYYINISCDLIVNQLKALIARDMLGYNAYFEIINQTDPTVLRAIKELNEGNAAFPVTLSIEGNKHD